MPIAVRQSIALATGPERASGANLYVVNYTGNTVTVYAPGKTSVKRTISKHLKTPVTMVFDRAGNLYVANYYGGGGKGHICVYSPGRGLLLRRIWQGVHFPVALALDGSNNLYVANLEGGGTLKGSVTVYAPGSTTVLRTISQGVDFPYALAFDNLGNLYVANNPAQTVTVYCPG